MKYALVNGVKTTPIKGLKGNCQLCAAEVVIAWKQCNKKSPKSL
jgi:hypothetical protein